MLAILLRPRELAEQQGPAFALNWRANYLSFATAWWQGFLEGGMLVFLSLFLVSRGFSVDFAGVLMGVVMIGVIVFQVPVSWLADRWGSTPVLLACYGIVGFGLMGIPWLAGPIALAAALFVFGACTGAMYPLGLARLSGNVPAGSLTRAYAWYLAIECIGSLGGAAVMGRARDIWGESAMFGVGLAALLLVLLGWAVLGWPRRKFAESNRANRGVSNRAPAESVI
jgi:MFS family permease